MNTATTPATAAAAAYCEADTGRAKAIAQWLDDHKQTRAWLARKARMASGTVSTLLAGRYPSPPADLLTQLEAVLAIESDRLASTPGYVDSSVHRLVTVVCDRTRQHGTFGIVTGSVGVGKTRALKEYARRKPQTVLIEAYPQMTPGVLLQQLLAALNVPAPASLDGKYTAAVKTLTGTTVLVIVDEAEDMTSYALHYLRRLRDMTGVGIVLAGTQRLAELIKPLNGQFDQIRSRVAMWPQHITRITRDDADDMARAALLAHGADEVPDDVLEALWDYGQGSARVLNEGLLPAVRDYAQGKALSAKLIDKLATSVLFMQPRAGAK